MEMNVDHIDLPPSWEWKYSRFVQALVAPKDYEEAFHVAMTRTALVLNREQALMKQLCLPRYQLGWYREAACWLRVIVEEQGAEIFKEVFQTRVSFWATIPCVKSSKGQFFLKSPAVSTEITTTRAIQEIMPERTLEVVGVSEQLGSFISKEFETVYFRKEDDERTLRFAMVQELASMQLASIQHKDVLRAAGCTFLDPEELIAEMDDWIADASLWEDIPAMRGCLRDLAPQLKTRLQRLQEYNVPLTLTHGDFSFRNVGFRRNKNGEKR